MTTFHERLKEERQRLKMTQPDFARVGGVTKGTQINYESGKRMPDVLYLTAISATGADVNYILTGHRSTAAGEPIYTLRPDQKALLDNYENCVKEDQDAIKRYALRAAEAIDKEIPEPEPETEIKKPNNGQ